MVLVGRRPPVADREGRQEAQWAAVNLCCAGTEHVFFTAAADVCAYTVRLSVQG